MNSNKNKLNSKNNQFFKLMQTQPKNAKKSLNQEGRESSKPLYLRMCASAMDTPKK